MHAGKAGARTFPGFTLGGRLPRRQGVRRADRGCAGAVLAARARGAGQRHSNSRRPFPSPPPAPLVPLRGAVYVPGERMTLKVTHIWRLSLHIGKTVTRCAGRKLPLSFGVSRCFLVMGAEEVAHGQVPSLFFAAGRAYVDVELAGRSAGFPKSESQASQDQVQTDSRGAQALERRHRGLEHPRRRLGYQ